MFDKGSFIEVMGEWAQTVICGRARLVCIVFFLRMLRVDHHSTDSHSLA